MSSNCTAYFLDAPVLLLTERAIVLRMYAAHACSFNYKSDYRSIGFNGELFQTGVKLHYAFWHSEITPNLNYS